MKKTGIVLSGGGARAAAHLGVLQALEELEFKIDALSGTSAGALVAALYAAGNRPAAILSILSETNYFSLAHLLLNKEGFFSLESLEKLLRAYIPFTRFEELPISLFVTATDLAANRSHTFCQGSLIEPVLASCSVPVLFEPYRFEGKQWVDGGVLNNFPVEPLTQHCNVIIGSHVNRIDTTLSPSSVFHKAHLFERCFHMAIAAGVYEKASVCSIFLDPPGLADYGMFDLKRGGQLFDIGYRYCMTHQKELSALHAVLV